MPCILFLSSSMKQTIKDTVRICGHKSVIPPVVPESLQEDMDALSGGKEDMMESRQCMPEALIDGCPGDPSATLTDIGRRPKLPTYHPGWFPNLHEMPGMIKDSALVAARSGLCPLV